jgi:hypothetical protein
MSIAPVGEPLGLVEVVGDEDEGQPEPVAQLAQRGLDRGLRCLVQRRGGLVEQQHRRP